MTPILFNGAVAIFCAGIGKGAPRPDGSTGNAYKIETAFKRAQEIAALVKENGLTGQGDETGAELLDSIGQ